jgi:hypothetical protein
VTTQRSIINSPVRKQIPSDGFGAFSYNEVQLARIANNVETISSRLAPQTKQLTRETQTNTIENNQPQQQLQPMINNFNMGDSTKKMVDCNAKQPEQPPPIGKIFVCFYCM